MRNFLFRLPNVKILEKIIFPVKNKHKGKYKKSRKYNYKEKWFLVSKTLIQFLHKATCNSFLHNKGTRNLYT